MNEVPLALADGAESPSEKVLEILSTPPDEWITKEQAHRVSGLSTKTLETRAKRGEIERVERKRPSDGRKVVLYRTDDVLRLRQATTRAPFPLPPHETGPALVQRVSLEELVALFHVARTASEKASAPAALFLTYAQAVTFSGLTRPQLREQVAAGKVATIGRGRGLRLRRRDLEAL